MFDSPLISSMWILNFNGPLQGSCAIWKIKKSFLLLRERMHPRFTNSSSRICLSSHKGTFSIIRINVL